MVWNAPTAIENHNAPMQVRMRRGWVGSSLVTQRKIASHDKKAGRFYAYMIRNHHGRWIKNGNVFGLNLVEAFKTAKAMREDWASTGDFKVVFDHYGCTRT